MLGALYKGTRIGAYLVLISGLIALWCPNTMDNKVELYFYSAILLTVALTLDADQKFIKYLIRFYLSHFYNVEKEDFDIIRSSNDLNDVIDGFASLVLVLTGLMFWFSAYALEMPYYYIYAIIIFIILVISVFGKGMFLLDWIEIIVTIEILDDKQVEFSSLLNSNPLSGNPIENLFTKIEKQKYNRVISDLRKCLNLAAIDLNDTLEDYKTKIGVNP